MCRFLRVPVYPPPEKSGAQTALRVGFYDMPFGQIVTLIRYMGVTKNRGTPKWMVYNGKPYFLMDDLGVPLLLETPI